MVVPAQEATKPWLESVAKKATTLWKKDLEKLFLDAENHFPDISWDTVEDKGDEGKLSRKVWGHKAMVYARATPEFRARYPTNSADGILNSHPSISAYDHTSLTRDLREIYTAHNSLLNADDESPVGVAPGGVRRPDQLQQDMAYLYSHPLHDDASMTIRGLPYYSFTELRTHNFLLSLRSFYFYGKLASGGNNLALSSSHFTSGSLYIILGYLYTGTLRFSHRKYDLSTAFYMIRGSQYLSLPLLQELIAAEITVEMLHGLHYATLSDDEYSNLTGDEWSTMANLGCRCRKCARRAPRVFQFCQEDGIQEHILERGARRALVALFGEGWCTEEFSTLPQNITDRIVTNIQEIITPINVFPLLFAAEIALLKLGTSHKSSAKLQAVKPKILVVRAAIENVLCESIGACFKTLTWRNIMEVDRENSPHLSPEKLVQVSWTLNAISRGASPQDALDISQALSSNKENWFPPLSGPIQSLLEETQVKLIKLRQLQMAHLTDPMVPPSILPSDVDELGSLNRSDSSGSFYSCISTQTRVISLEEPISAWYSAYLASLDIEAASSSYSVASSRTNSTDYGLYFTRWAISQETLQSEEQSGFHSQSLEMGA